MNHFEECPITYRSFGEGEYIHRYFLSEMLQAEMTPREVLVMYTILKDFNIRTLCEKMLPSRLRWVSSLDEINKRAELLLADDLVIHYADEKLTRIIPKEHVNAVVSACRAYIRELEDVYLTEADTDALISLNERLRLFQDSIAKQVLEKYSALGSVEGHDEITIECSFKLSDKSSEYLELNHNVLFRFQELLETGVAGLHQNNSKVWNTKQDVHEGRLYQTPHCWLFRYLEHYSAMPLKHFLKIRQVTAKLQTIVKLDIMFE